ncbi:MAG: MaoC family dehydratase [Acetobacteraceae bacterium]|nr:MaoC family dehydratase [Acetobacteraceae bacterium]
MYLEDLAVGRVFAAGPITVTEEEIVDFARRWDPQPFHLDHAAAKAHPIFQGLAASGWHTAALMMSMVAKALEGLPWGVVGSGGELQWTRPVRPGDMLRLEVEVMEVTPSRSKPDRGTALMRNRVLNGAGEVVTEFTPRIIVQRRPGA